MKTIKLILPCLILCLLLTAFGGCGGPTQEGKESDTDYWYLIKPDADTLQAITSENLLLVNKTHPSDASYSVELTELPEDIIINHDKVELEKTAAIALCAMISEMQADGIKDTFVTSGYRSYSYQAQLFQMYCEREKSQNPSLSQSEAEALVLTYSARPGTSEHQTGLCVDFMTNTMTELDNSFERSRAFEWLTENAYRFGFILRYPEDKEDVTGYSYESWHYRFVGRAAATVIHEKNETLEEYLETVK